MNDSRRVSETEPQAGFQDIFIGVNLVSNTNSLLILFNTIDKFILITTDISHVEYKPLIL